MAHFAYETYNSQFGKKKKNKVLIILLSSISSILLVLACAVLGIFIYIQNSYELFPVSGQSMAQTINPNGTDEDYVYVEKTQDVDYMDIIVYERKSGSSSTMVIKRLIAKAGDWIGFRRSGRLINNYHYEYEMVVKYGGEGDWHAIKEDYVTDTSLYYDTFVEFTRASAGQDLEYEDCLVNNETQIVTYTKIPENHIFYIGDNRYAMISYDCIDYGPMNQENIYGKVKFLVHGSENKFFQILKQFFGVIEWK